MESNNKQHIPSGIILGQCGAGKTKLYNKICGTKHDVGIAYNSLTITLHRHTIMHDNKNFTIMDTPGVDPTEDIYKHNFMIKEALIT